MNLRAVRYLTGWVGLLVSVSMLVPAAVSLVYRELATAWQVTQASLIGAAPSLLLVLSGRRSLHRPDGRPAYFRREGIAVAGLGWFVGGAIGALPLLTTGTLDSPVDALFESISAFTTTGSTIFTGAQIDALPRGINFWRCFAQWIGGVGIVLVFVAILPAGGRTLFRSEGLDRAADESKAKDSALRLLLAYCILTAAGTLGLWLAGLDFFDASVHAFTCLSTGGFSSRGASIGHYDSPAVEAVCIAIMVAGGMNFALWTTLLLHGPSKGWEWAARSSELRSYLVALAGGSAIVALLLWRWGGSKGLPGSGDVDYTSVLRCLRDASFSLVSLQTTTGLATADFDRWPDSCRVLLMGAGILGACVGSTGGGAKIARLLLAARSALASVRSYTRPRAIFRIEMDGENADPAAIDSALRLTAVWCAAALAGVLGLALLGNGPTEAITGTIACLNTMGPGLGAIGPAQCFQDLGDASKLLLSALMLLGRLEFYTLVVLFLPSFWRA